MRTLDPTRLYGGPGGPIGSLFAPPPAQEEFNPIDPWGIKRGTRYSIRYSGLFASVVCLL
jgi:hypothetical protein